MTTRLKLGDRGNAFGALRRHVRAKVVALGRFWRIWVWKEGAKGRGTGRGTP